MLKKFRSVFFYPLDLKVIILKSIFYSLYYELWLVRNNFQKIKSLHNLIENENHIKYSEVQNIKIKYIAKSISILSKYSFWKPKCYNQALTARRLLADYDIPSVFKIGFRKRNNKIDGHAWVRCNTLAVSGYLSDLESFKPLKSIN